MLLEYFETVSHVASQAASSKTEFFVDPPQDCIALCGSATDEGVSESASDLEPGILQLATSKVPVCTANTVNALHISSVPTNVKNLCFTPELARH